jgi:hypothetical protein
MLAPRHVGWARTESLGGRSLEEFLSGQTLSKNGFQESLNALEALGFIEQHRHRGEWVPVHSMEILSMVWELRNYPEESVCVGRMLPQLYEEIQGELLLRSRQDAKDEATMSKEEKKDKTRRLVPYFFSIILQLIDRYPHDPESGVPPLHEHTLFGLDHPHEREVFQKWEKIFEENYNEMPQEFHHLRSKVAPGTPLDGTLYFLIEDRHFADNLSNERKKSLKERIWHVGSILQRMKNSLLLDDQYCDVFSEILHTSFNHFFAPKSTLKMLRHHLGKVG